MEVPGNEFWKDLDLSRKIQNLLTVCLLQVPHPLDLYPDFSQGVHLPRIGSEKGRDGVGG